MLYGFRSYAKETCIVEGYLDVCMCAQNNINAVSSLGTAITPHHIELVWEKSDEVALWFDGDLAGQKAALKLAKEAFSVIKPSKILSFINSPLGEDPASFLQNKGDFAQLWNAREHLLDKVWNSENPKNQKTPEMCVAKYKTVQSYAEMIQDRELRGLYTQGFRQKWFEKRSDKTQSARTKTVATNPDPKSTYEMILLMTVFYFPEIFDEVCDYLLSMNLEGSYFHLRERLLNKTQNIIDLNTSDMLKSGEVLCTLQKLNTIAPFTLRPSTEDIVKGWMEVFSFYCDCMTSRRQNE